MKKATALRHGTTELPSKAQRGELVIAFRPFVAAHVRLIHRDGLHGINVGETADRLMGDAIMREIKRGRCPLLMQDGQGGLKRLDHTSQAADADKLARHYVQDSPETRLRPVTAISEVLARARSAA